MSVDTIPEGHFDGGKNLNKGSRSSKDSVILEEWLGAIITQANANEAGAKDIKDSVKLATAAALGACTAAGTGVGKTLTQNAAAVENIDGVAPVVGDRILVKDQVAAQDNGIYVVTTVGTVAVKQVLTRATDADADAEVTSGLAVFVDQGTANQDTWWTLTTNDPITVDTTALVFTRTTPYTHATRHERGGADEIDGDHLDIDLTPVNYAPSIVPAEAANVDDLAAHLAGIDDELGVQDVLIAANTTEIDELYARQSATALPMLTGVRVAGGTMTAAGEASTLVGANFLQGMTFAHLLIGTLDIIAEEPGTPGNAYSVEVVDTGIGGLAVTFLANVMTIDQGGSGSNEDLVATAINAAGPPVWGGIIRANSGAGGVVPVTVQTPLAGGTGTGIQVLIAEQGTTLAGEAGAGATSNPAVAATQISAAAVDLTAIVPALQAADVISVRVVSNGKSSESVSMVLA